MFRATRFLFVAALFISAGLAFGCSDKSAKTSDSAEEDASSDSSDTDPGDVASDADGAGADSTMDADEADAEAGDAGTTRADSEMADSVTQYGITWSFDEEYETGQFVTGDWWVVGPVTIDSVSPEPDADRNGSMLDPVGAQAYDGRGGRYEADAGVSFPLELQPDHSLVSSISHPEQPECQQGRSDGWETYNGVCQRGPIRTQAVLTILAEPPPASAFRPPYSGQAKPLHRASDIDWSMLPDLDAPDNLPDGEGLLRHVERPWIDHLGSWTMQHGCATHNMFCYGRELGNIVANLAAFALVESEHQEEAARRLIQLGIDNYGVLEAGGGWGADGGHFNGRKFPIVFAGGLLGVDEMASPGNDIGNEDRMTYYGNDGTALWGRDCTDCYLPAGCTYNDQCTGGSKDCRDPDGLVDGCGDYRNCCTSKTWVGTALAIRLMDLQDAWDHDPFFDYVERWMAGDVPGGGGTSSDFVTKMWELHWP
jgi:hypothetical protein